MEFRPNLGEVVRTLRRERGWTQGRVAKEAGYSTQSPLSKIENGQKGASFHEIWALCEVLGYSLAEVENGLRAAEEGRFPDWVEMLRTSERAGAVSVTRRWSERRGSDDALLQAALRDDGREDNELMGEMVRGMAAFVRLIGRLSRSK